MVKKTGFQTKKTGPNIEQEEEDREQRDGILEMEDEGVEDHKDEDENDDAMRLIK